jgi:uncharacterized protein (TIGR03083 family)
MDPVVELQIQVFRDIDALLGSLSDEDWQTETECPGWSVQDNVAHIIGTESMLLGRDAPAHDPGTKPWVHNPIGEGNEIQVDYRRTFTPQQVLDEYREVTSERISGLEQLTDAELGADSWTPVGPGTVRDLLAVRIMDCWVHEQDIRRAVGKPGGLEGPVAAHAFGRHRGAMGFVVGKKAGAPDGTTVVVDVAGQQPIAVAVEGKRANILSDAPADPDVRLSMDLETFNRLCCGRGPVDDVASGVKIEGDADLGRRIVQNMNFMI